jgi:hypothetical protein
MKRPLKLCPRGPLTGRFVPYQESPKAACVARRKVDRTPISYVSSHFCTGNFPATDLQVTEIQVKNFDITPLTIGGAEK